MRGAGIFIVVIAGAVCVLSVVVLIFLALSACTNVQAFIWPGSVRCETAPSVRVAVAVDEVLRRDGLADALGDKAVATLEDIARETSAEAVVCALVQLRDSYLLGAEGMPVYAARARRAQAFLDDRGIAIVKGTP